MVVCHGLFKEEEGGWRDSTPDCYTGSTGTPRPNQTRLSLHGCRAQNKLEGKPLLRPLARIKPIEPNHPRVDRVEALGALPLWLF